MCHMLLVVFLKNLFLLPLIMCIHVDVCGYVTMNTDALAVQKKVSDTWSWSNRWL